MPIPTEILHADWGSQPNKRILSRALLEPDGSYRLTCMTPIKNPAEWSIGLRQRIQPDQSIWLGFDFPIGLPIAYAQNIGVVDFFSFLLSQSAPDWADFFNPALEPHEISNQRPFYPARPGAAKRSHLTDGLGISSFSELLRSCEVSPALPRSAAPLFWTLGGQQVGKAAILGWRDVILPWLQTSPDSLAIWPFSGCTAPQATPGQVTMFETYPAYYALSLGLRADAQMRQAGKRSLVYRLAAADILLRQAKSLRLAIPEIWEKEIASGFANPNGDDWMDSLVGLLGMLQVIRGDLPLKLPINPIIHTIEGWILGLPV